MLPLSRSSGLLAIHIRTLNPRRHTHHRRLTGLFPNHATNVHHQHPLALQHQVRYFSNNRGQSHDENCITPTYLAVVLNNPTLLKILIQSGAKVNLPNQAPNFADMHSILDEYDSATPLIGSIEKGSTECFNILINTPGIDLEGRGHNQKTPLLAAIKAKRYDMAFKLLEKNVDINAQDAHGYTPILLAILNSHVPLLKALLDAGANLHFKNDWKQNLWHIAARNPNFDVIGQWLSAGGIYHLINEEDAYGRTPLAHAVENANYQAVTTLLTYGANCHLKLGHLTGEVQLPFGELSIVEFARKILNKFELNFATTILTDKERWIRNCKIIALKEIIALLEFRVSGACE